MRRTHSNDELSTSTAGLALGLTIELLDHDDPSAQQVPSSQSSSTPGPLDVCGFHAPLTPGTDQMDKLGVSPHGSSPEKKSHLGRAIPRDRSAPILGRARVESESDDLSPQVSVIVRCRPVLKGGVDVVEFASEPRRRGQKVSFMVRTRSLELESSLLEGRPGLKLMRFDAVYPTSAKQVEIFEYVKPMIKHALEGHTSTVFSFGAPSSGKTYTMWGPPASRSLRTQPGLQDQDGIFPRAAQHLFERDAIEKIKAIKMSFLLIHSPDGEHEKLEDLLNFEDEKAALEIVASDPGTSNGSSFVCKNLHQVQVKTWEQMHLLLTQGQMRLRLLEKSLKGSLSRSQSVVQVSLELASRDQTAVQMSKLAFVDLAWVDKTDDEMQSFVAAARVDEILMKLGTIARNPSNGSNANSNTAETAAERSALSRLLQDGLTCGTRVLVVANVAPEVANFDGTANALTLASQMSKMRRKFVVPAKSSVGEKGRGSALCAESVEAMSQMREKNRQLLKFFAESVESNVSHVKEEQIMQERLEAEQEARQKEEQRKIEKEEAKRKMMEMQESVQMAKKIVELQSDLKHAQKEVAETQKQLLEARGRINTLTETNGCLEADVKGLTARGAAYNEVIQNLREDMKASSAELQQLQHTLGLAQQENCILQAEVDALTKERNDRVAQQVSQTEKWCGAEAEIEWFRGELAAAQTSQEELVELKKEAARLRGQLLSGELAVEHTSQEEFIELKNENQRLREQLAAEQNSQEELKKEAVEATEQLLSELAQERRRSEELGTALAHQQKPYVMFQRSPGFDDEPGRQSPYQERKSSRSPPNLREAYCSPDMQYLPAFGVAQNQILRPGPSDIIRSARSAQPEILRPGPPIEPDTGSGTPPRGSPHVSPRGSWLQRMA